MYLCQDQKSQCGQNTKYLVISGISICVNINFYFPFSTESNKNIDCIVGHFINMQSRGMWPVWLHTEETMAFSCAFVMAGIRAPVTKGDDLCSQPLLHFGTTN